MQTGRTFVRFPDRQRRASPLDGVPSECQCRTAQSRNLSFRLRDMRGWDAAIVIPAKDEERRIRTCLDAAGRAIRKADGARVGLVLVVNNTMDGTALRARDWALGGQDIPFVLVDCTFHAARAGVGAARRLGLGIACTAVSQQGALLTSDADTMVRDDWVIRNLAELRHADLICGTLLGRPDEARALPAAIDHHGSIERDYLAATIRLVAQLDPRSHDAAAAHHSAGGASLAVSRSVYEAVGGMPTLAVREDTAFAERVEAQDFRTRYSSAVVVETSCRLTGRTGGGMAGTLRERATDQDPHADDWLETADALVLRHGLRGRLRSVWPAPSALRLTLHDSLGADLSDRIMATAPGPYFGAFFAKVERTAPALVRHRLRMSDCRRELPRLRAYLDGLNTPDTAAKHCAERTAQPTDERATV